MRADILEAESRVGGDCLLVSQVPHVRVGRGRMRIQPGDIPAAGRDPGGLVQTYGILAVLTGDDRGRRTQQVVGVPVGTLKALVGIVLQRAGNRNAKLIISVPKPQRIGIIVSPVAAPQDAVMLSLGEAIRKAQPRTKVMMVGVHEVRRHPRLRGCFILDAQSGIVGRDLRHHVPETHQVVNGSLKHDGMRVVVEPGQALIRKIRGAVVFPAHSKVERQPRVHPEIVLEVERLLADVVEVGLPIGVGQVAGYSQVKIGRLGARVRHGRVRGPGRGVVKRCGKGAKILIARCVLLIGKRVVVLVLKRSAKLQRVPPDRLG